MDIDIDAVDIDTGTDMQLLEFSQCHLRSDLHTWLFLLLFPQGRQKDSGAFCASLPTLVKCLNK